MRVSAFLLVALVASLLVVAPTGVAAQAGPSGLQSYAGLWPYSDGLFESTNPDQSARASASSDLRWVAYGSRPDPEESLEVVRVHDSGSRSAESLDMPYIYNASTFPVLQAWVDDVEISGDGDDVFAWVRVTQDSEPDLEYVQLVKWHRTSGVWDSGSILKSSESTLYQNEVSVSEDGDRYAYTFEPDDGDFGLWVSTRTSAVFTPSPPTTLLGLFKLAGAGDWLFWGQSNLANDETTYDIMVDDVDSTTSTAHALDGVTHEGLSSLDVSDGGRYALVTGDGNFGASCDGSCGPVFLIDRDHDDDQVFDEVAPDDGERHTRWIDTLSDGGTPWDEDSTVTDLSAPKISGDGLYVVGGEFDLTNCGSSAEVTPETFPLEGSEEHAEIRTYSVAGEMLVDAYNVDVYAEPGDCGREIHVGNSGATVGFATGDAYRAHDDNGYADWYVYRRTTWWGEYIESLFGRNTNADDAGDPVNVSIGNYHETHTDLSFPSNAYGMDWSRTYNSMSTVSGDLGLGWSSSFGQRFTTDGVNGWTLREADGRTLRFLPNGSSWTQPRDFDGVIDVDTTTDPPNVTITLTYPNGEVWTFDNDGWLAEMENAAGDTVTITRTADKLDSVVASPSGMELDFTYDTGGDLVEVIAAGSETRTVYYTYQDTVDDLPTLASASEAVIDEENDPYAVRSYGLDTAGERVADVSVAGLNYTETYDPVTIVELEYWPDGRVKHQDSQDGDLSEFSYNDATHKTSVTDVHSGDTTVYATARNGDTIAVDSADPDDEELERTFDDQGHLVGLVDRSGVESGWFYDQWGRVQERATPDPDLVSPDLITVPNPETGFGDPGTEGWGLESIDYVDEGHEATNGVDYRVESVTDAAGQVTSYTYTGSSRVPSSTTRGTGGDAITTNQTVVAGRVTASRDGDGVTSCRYFNSDGTLDASATLLGETTTGNYASKCADPDGADSDWFDPAVSMITTIDYNSLGQVTGTRPPAFQPSTRTTCATSATGCTTYTYWGNGRTRKVIDPLGAETETEYAPMGYASKTIDADDNETTTLIEWRQSGTECGDLDENSSFDDTCRIETTTGPVGDSTGTTTSVYDKSGDLRTVHTPGSSTPTTYTYGPLARLDAVTDPAGAVTRYVYDNNGRLTASFAGDTVTDTDVATETLYDRLGRVMTVTQPKDDTYRPVTTTEYNKAGQRISEVTAAGTAVEIEQSWTYLSNGLTDTETLLRSDAPSPTDTTATTIYTYTPGGRVSCVERRVDAAAAGIAEKNHFTATDYDVAGRAAFTATQLSDVDDCTDGRDGSGTLDPAAWAINATGFDAGGRVEWTQIPTQFQAWAALTSPDPEDHDLYRTTLGYDDAGRTTTVTSPDPSDPGNSTVTTRTCFTARGEVDKTIDASGAVTDYDYYPSGQLDRVVNPLGMTWNSGNNGCDSAPTDGDIGTVTYTYDDAGNRETRSTWHGETDTLDAEIFESWDYDDAGRLTSYRDSLHEPVAKTGDPSTAITYTVTDGRLASKTTTTGSTSDNSARETVETYFDSGKRDTVTTTHDDGGSDPQTITGYTYDQVGRAKTVVDKTDSQNPQTITFDYNQASNITKVTYPDASNIEYQWNLVGNNTRIKTPAGGYFRTEYDEAMNPSEVDQWFIVWNDLVVYTHNANGQQTGGNINGSTANDFRDYTIDDLTGLRTGMDQKIASRRCTWTLTYDTNGRLATDEQTDSSCGTALNQGETTYTYDDANQLLSATAASPASGEVKSWAYTYANNGNRLTQTVTRDGDTNPYETTYTYRPDAIQLDSAATEHDTTTIDDITYSYDDAGRRVTEDHATGNDTAHTYTPDGHLKATTIGTATQTRTYDPMGMINSIDNATGGDYSKLWWDYTGATGAVPQLIQWTGNGLNRSFSYGSERITGSGTWYGYDHLGSTITTHTGTNPDLYDPYGNPEPTFTNNLDYAYRAELTLRGTTYLRARDYDPTTGQFLTRDPLDGVDGTPTTANPYHYADNDPLNKTDPTGLRASDECLRTTFRFKGVCIDVADFVLSSINVFGPVRGRHGGYRGFCGTAGATAGGADIEQIWNLANTGVGYAAEGSMCLFDDGTELYAAKYFGVGPANGFAMGVSFGLIYTNVSDVNDFAGPFSCWGASLSGEALGVNAEICLAPGSGPEGWGPAYSVYVGDGTIGMPSIEVRATSGTTTVSEIWSHSQVRNWAEVSTIAFAQGLISLDEAINEALVCPPIPFVPRDMLCDLVG